MEAKPNSAAVKVFYVISMLGAIVGAIEFFLSKPESAPQQAAIAGMALAYAVIPYVLARAIQELGR